MNNDNVRVTRSQTKKRNLEISSSNTNTVDFDENNIEKITTISNIVLSSVFDSIINHLNKKIKLDHNLELEDANDEYEDEDEEYFDSDEYKEEDEDEDIELKNKEDNDFEDEDLEVKLNKDTKKFLKDNIHFKECIFVNYSKEEKIYFNNLKYLDKEFIYDSENKIIDENLEIEPYRFKILNLDIDFNTKNFLLKKVKQIEEYTSSSDSAKFKTWIDNFLLLPINKYNHLPINLNDSNTDKIKYLKKCNDILDLSIYGHKQPKDNILRILAQWINKPDAYGNCIALQGPMGNGKTTLVRNGICKAMDRPFGFISLGGCSDSSYLVGHDFTYEGSLYGKIAQILIECKCMNPIIYFDELDKISEDLKGKEIVNALIHITDNSQNSTFEDKYFSGIKLDLSKVLFVFSYNNEDLIDPILKDRLTIIKTNGYNLEDKVKIGHQFLITEQINKMGLNSDDIIFDDESLKYIINNFTKEEGVRDLKRCIEKIISKINLLLLLNNDYTNINVDYKLDVLEIPFKLSTKIIDKLLKNDNIVDDNISRRMMYL